MIRVRDAIAGRFALDESFIYMSFLLVIGSLFDFISFRVIVVLIVILISYFDFITCLYFITLSNLLYR